MQLPTLAPLFSAGRLQFTVKLSKRRKPYSLDTITLLYSDAQLYVYKLQTARALVKK